MSQFLITLFDYDYIKIKQDFIDRGLVIKAIYYYETELKQYIVTIIIKRIIYDLFLTQIIRLLEQTYDITVLYYRSLNIQIKDYNNYIPKLINFPTKYNIKYEYSILYNNKQTK